MRLDKFLKVSGLIRRRPIAKEMCDAGRVFLNERPAKAASEVGVGDVLEIQWQHRLLRVRVLALPSSAVRKAEAKALYEVLADQRLRVLPETWWRWSDEDPSAKEAVER